MTSPFSDELITAYLDGELTDDERADVEKQMREDSELRSLCDDLQKLRHTLQAVPVVEPSAGLAQRVLRQAERRMLLGDDSAGHEPVRRPGDSDRSHPTGSSKATLNNWNWRLTATAIGSVAALLLVAMFLFSPLYKSPSVGNVALAPESDRSGALQSQGRPLAETAEELSDSEAELAADAYARSPTDGASTAPATARPEAAGERLDEAEIGQLMEPVELSRSRPSAVPRQRSAGRKAIAADDDLSAVPRYNLGEADETARYGAAGNGALGGGAERKGTAKEDTAKRDTAKRKTTDHDGGFGYDTELAPGRETGDYPAPPVSRMETDDRPGIAGSMQYGERPEAKGQSYELAAPTTAEALRRGSQPRSSQWRQLARGWDGKDALLVQVSLPDGVSATATLSPSDENVQLRLLEEAREGVSAGPRFGSLAIQAPSATPQVEFGDQLRRSITNVILVEGSRAEIQQSLQRLADQPDIQFGPATVVGKMSAGGEVFFVEPGIADARDKLPALGIEQESIVEDAVEPELAMQRQQISDQNMKQRNMLQADSDLPTSDSEQDNLLAGQRSLGSSEALKKSRAADRSSEQENQPAGAQSVEMSSAGKLKQEKDTPRPSTEPANASELSSEQPRTWQYFLFRIREEAKVEKP